MGWTVFALSILTATARGEKAQATTPSHEFSTPQSVWNGFDPRAEPLDVSLSQSWSEHGADYTEMLFTGTTRDKSVVRINAIYSADTNQNNLPGILHIHGGGQTASTPWLRFWNERGYAALTFDWCGKWEDRKKKKTRIGRTLEQGNHSKSGRMRQATRPSVHHSSWYLWTRIARRALTLLELQLSPDTLRH